MKCARQRTVSNEVRQVYQFVPFSLWITYPFSINSLTALRHLFSLIPNCASILAGLNAKVYSYRILLVDHLTHNNLLCTITDAVHSSNPCHLISLLHTLCYALRCFHLLDNEFKTVLYLLVHVSQISSQFAAENKVVKADRVMFFKIIPVQPSPTTNRSGFFWQTNIGNIVRVIVYSRTTP